MKATIPAAPSSLSDQVMIRIAVMERNTTLEGMSFGAIINSV